MLLRPVVPDASAPAPMPVPIFAPAQAAALSLALLLATPCAVAQTTTETHHTHHPAHPGAHHTTTTHTPAHTASHTASHVHPPAHAQTGTSAHGHAHAAPHAVAHAHAPAHHPATHAAHVAAVAPKPAARPIPAAPATPPAPPPPADKGTVTGLPLPRFASLRAEEVNLRSGPGTRYPIQWVYHRRGLPVQIEREFDVWRLIEDMDGVKGWVNQATLVGNRDVVVTEPLALLRDAPQAAGATVAVLRAGVVGRVLDCAAAPAGSVAEPLSGPASLPTPADAAPATPAPAAPTPATPATDAPASDTTLGTTAAPQGDTQAQVDPAADAALAQAVASARAGVTRPAPANAQPGWCHVRVKDYTGWLPRDVFYGLEAGEVIAPS